MITTMQYALMYLVSVPVFFAIDMLWLGFIAPGFYKSQIGHLMAGTVNWPIGILFYLVFLIGLLIFAIVPAVEARSWTYALLFGALFGFFTYATYDLTNWATLKDWPALVSIVDMLWGTFLSGAVATASYFIIASYIVK